MGWISLWSSIPFQQTIVYLFFHHYYESWKPMCILKMKQSEISGHIGTNFIWFWLTKMRFRGWLLVYLVSISTSLHCQKYMTLLRDFAQEWSLLKWDFSISAVTNNPNQKNLISLFPLIFLSKHISLYALGRLK